MQTLSHSKRITLLTEQLRLQSGATTNYKEKSISVHKFNPICKVFDFLYTGVRNAADYLVRNYVNLPLPMNLQIWREAEISLAK
jgi:hypothetical protein